MGEEINKFDQIGNIFSKFTEKNKENLIYTAQSLLKIQCDSGAMIANNEPPAKSADNNEQRAVSSYKESN